MFSAPPGLEFSSSYDHVGTLFVALTPTFQMKSSELSFRNKLQACADVLAYWPGMALVVLLFSLMAAVLEGLGLSFILPIIELVRDGGTPAGGNNSPVRYFVWSFRALGVPLTVGTAVCSVIVIMLCRFGSTFLANYLAGVFRMYYVRHLQEQAFSKVLQADLSYFDREGTSSILNVVITQSRKVGMNLIRPALKVVEVGLISAVYVGIALFISFELTLMTGVVVLVVALLLKWGTASGEELGDDVAGANEQLQDVAQTSTQGIREVKSYNQADAYFERFRDEQDRHCDSRIALIRNKELIRNFYNFATIGAVFGLIFFALRYTSLQVGALGLFLVILFRLSPKVSVLQGKWYTVIGELPHLIRTIEFIERIPVLNDDDRDIALDAPVESIAFDRVTFAYQDEPVLHDVSFGLDRSETVAFVGPTGSGKSTIAELLMGFYPEYEGTIRVNDDELRSVDLESWWRRVSLVRQSPYIFDETLRANVVMGAQEGSEEKLHRILEQTLVKEFLGDLDNGVETVLGDRGVRLSGGQKQRIALARALYRDSDVLILDEATSALDYETEQAVFNRISPMLSNRLVLLIAHRLSTVQNADAIYFLENGRIRESGTHEELMENEGGYHQLYSVQTGAGSVEEEG